MMAETQEQLRLDGEVVERMVVEIWAALVGLPASVAAVADADGGGEGELCSSVEVTGQWRGRVLLGCNDQLATTIARAMFEIDAAAVSDEDRRDALGELANIVGGNFKALLIPLSSEIALPRVTRGPEAQVRADERLIAAVGLSCAGQLLRLRFVQSS